MRGRKCQRFGKEETLHREFLADTEGDPRPDLIESMLADLGKTGSIVVHHADFETKRIEELATFCPEQAEALSGLIARIMDTEIPFKENWYLHPGLRGRSSIKVVLPTLVPDLSYAGLEIGEGQSAALIFGDMYEGRLDGEARETARRDLLEPPLRYSLAVGGVERQRVSGVSDKPTPTAHSQEVGEYWGHRSLDGPCPAIQTEPHSQEVDGVQGELVSGVRSLLSRESTGTLLETPGDLLFGSLAHLSSSCVDRIRIDAHLGERGETADPALA
jgi:hypothetical protein